MQTLIEILVEDLPSRYIDKIEREFAYEIIGFLRKKNLVIKSHTSFSTPRRFGLILDSEAASRPFSEKKRGLSHQIFYDKDGKITQAGEKFLAKNSLQMSDIIEEQGYINYKLSTASISAIDLITDGIAMSLRSTSVPTMEYGEEIRFNRPVRSICIVSDELGTPNKKILGLDVVDFTYGHRLLAPSKVKVSADSYFSELAKSYVIASKLERIKIIEKSIGTIDADIVDTLANLVEYPVVLRGRFPAEYLPPALPRELVELVLENQKYIPILQNGELTNEFFFVANLPETTEIIKGNELVITPRLKDAKFFLEQDKARGLDYYSEKLKEKLLFNGLGTLADKCSRISNTLARLCELGLLTFDEQIVGSISSAVKLYRADVMTNIVFEFPEMEGKIGKYLTSNFPEQNLLTFIEMLDDLDTLIGFFSIGEIPTASRDPYTLKRKSENFLSKFTFETSVFDLIWLHIEQSPELTLSEEHLQKLHSFLFDRIFSESIKDEIIENILDYWGVSPCHTFIDNLTSFKSHTVFIPALQAAKRFFGFIGETSFVFSDEDDANALPLISDELAQEFLDELNEYFDKNKILDEHKQIASAHKKKMLYFQLRFSQFPLRWQNLVQKYLS